MAAASAIACTMAASWLSGKPSSRMKLALSILGSAPDTARSLTVPLTASAPIDPPGKNSGRTTKESVLMARLPSPQIEEGGIPEVLEGRVAEGGKKQVLDQFTAQLAAAAVAHHDFGIIGQRQWARPVGKVGGSTWSIGQLRFLVCMHLRISSWVSASSQKPRRRVFDQIYKPQILRLVRRVGLRSG